MTTLEKSKRMKLMRSPTRYFGGKGILRANIIPVLESIEHTHYVEPFAGGASVLLAKTPAKIETYNDIDNMIYNFFMVLAKPEDFKEFHRLVTLLPYSRSLLRYANKRLQLETDSVMKAVWWFICSWQSFNFKGQPNDTWGFNKTQRNTRVSNYLAGIDRLPEIHQRLQSIQLENDTWQKVISRYDTPQTLFYCDPPYIQSTRRSGGYNHEMTDDDHKELVETLLKLKSKVVLSAYEHPIYQPLIDTGWSIQRIKTVAHGTRIKSERVECLYISSNISHIGTTQD